MSELDTKDAALYKLTHILYALQAASFFFGLTLIVAVIINYVKQDDVRGSWLESHFTWQIRTFWYVLLMAVVGGLSIGLGLGLFILSFATIWLLYRIIKGWFYLYDKKPLYLTQPYNNAR